MSNATSLKKLKVGVESNKDLRAKKKLVYDKKSSVINSLQMLADKNFGETSNPDLIQTSFAQKTFPVKSDQHTTKSSVGNYTYNDLSFYLKKKPQPTYKLP